VNRNRTTNSMGVAYQLLEGPHLANLSARNDDSSQFGSHSTGSVGYGYRFTPSLRANVSYGTSFRAPTFNQLYYPDFGVPTNRPEKGKNTEFGLFYAEGATQLSAVYYHNRIEDLIINIARGACPIAGYPGGCAYNINQAVLKGWSLSAGTKTGNFIWRGTLDLQDPRDETLNRQLERRAKQHGTVAAEYVTGATNVGMEVVFSGERFEYSSSDTFRLPGYGLLNFYASRQIAKDWSLFGRWDNVFDKDYELARGYATAGSNVFIGVRYGMR
jgi:vitamin B12 transporter